VARRQPPLRLAEEAPGRPRGVPRHPAQHRAGADRRPRRQAPGLPAHRRRNRDSPGAHGCGRQGQCPGRGGVAGGAAAPSGPASAAVASEYRPGDARRGAGGPRPDRSLARGAPRRGLARGGGGDLPRPPRRRPGAGGGRAGRRRAGEARGAGAAGLLHRRPLGAVPPGAGAGGPLRDLRLRRVLRHPDPLRALRRRRLGRPLPGAAPAPPRRHRDTQS
jgi:hypothetical protein